MRALTGEEIAEISGGSTATAAMVGVGLSFVSGVASSGIAGALWGARVGGYVGAGVGGVVGIGYGLATYRNSRLSG